MKKLTSLFFFTLLFLGLNAQEKKTIFFNNGKAHFEYQVEKGMLNGAFASYYENGQLKMQGSFTNNQKTGQWKIWDENGQLRSDRVYMDNDNFSIEKEWNSNGKSVKKKITEKKNQVQETANKTSDATNILFAKKTWTIIDKSNSIDPSFFEGQGLSYFLKDGVTEGVLTPFEDAEFTKPIKRDDFGAMLPFDITGIRLKQFTSFSTDKQTMITTVIGLGIIGNRNGVEKEIAWFYLPGIETERVFTPDAVKALNLISNQQFKFGINAVSTNDNELETIPSALSEEAALNIFDLEAAAIVSLTEK